jgi:genome maintenance exonuclease 1
MQPKEPKSKKFTGHTYDDIGRIYTFDDGSKYYSATTALGFTADKTALIKWQKRVGREEADRQSEYASRVGTAMHECLEDYLNGKTPVYPNSVVEHLAKQIIPYLDTRVEKVARTEMVLYSDRLQIAGTADCICIYKVDTPRIVILDFKTSKRLKREEWLQDYYIQLALYSMMLEEVYHIKTNVGVLLFAYKETYHPKREFIVTLDGYKKQGIHRVKIFHEKVKKIKKPVDMVI